MSDRYLVMTVIEIRMQQMKRICKEKKEDEIVDWKNLEEVKHRIKYVEELRKFIRKLRAEVYGEVTKLCEASCKGIMEAVKNVCGVKTKGRGKRGTEWWSEDTVYS